MRLAWVKMDHVFSVRRRSDVILELPSVKNNNILITDNNNTDDISGDSIFPVILEGCPNYPKKLLDRHPVDLLVVDKSSMKKPPSLPVFPWERVVSSAASPNRPKVILESWRAASQLWAKGPSVKSCVTRWKALGYESFIKLVRGTDVGGAIQQTRVLVARVQTAEAHRWRWPRLFPEESLRPMSNLLTPTGLVPAYLYLQDQECPTAAVARLDSMPDRPGARIRTERGVRGLLAEEYCRGLGLTSSDSTKLSRSVAIRTTSVFHWEYLSPVLSGTAPTSPLPAAASSTPMDAFGPIPADTESVPPFQWSPPDLQQGGKWFLQRVRNLRLACQPLPDPAAAYDTGISILNRHRLNYDSSGPCPKWLQLLWWEFPPEHWDQLREGCKQNFLIPPPEGLTPNATMDSAGLAAAAAFVDELLDLGVVRDIEEGMSILANAPLFVVEKEGQPGQWRVIADMRKGGQNECIGSDPCFLPRSNHILEEMYTGGVSAVVDMSKYFYNFPSHVDDRPYLGLIHPITAILYAYFGLPMGSANSPANACKFGVSFLRQLRERFAIFTGQGTANCFWSSFRDEGYDPDLGYGFVLKHANGLAIKMWAFVDDFLIHGPDYPSVNAALRLFLDAAVECGMLAHPDKLILPSREVKYCGFLFNTVGIPCLKIPVSKRERALAICEHMQQGPVDKQWSRLGLAVAAGVLESLTDATPRRMGHNKLRSLHAIVHPADAGTGLEPYCTTTTLNPAILRELKWWETFLLSGNGRQVRGSKAATLVPTFGDGSGTGTGGTFILPEQSTLMWSGTWHPVVYSFSSNWKELATLRESLRRLLEHRPPEIEGSTVFYFTDNSTTYYIAASGSSPHPRLHDLISDIRLLELQLAVVLEVIHVPGLVMIEQGTDGLSRGIWMSGLHSFMDERRLLQGIFDPVTYDSSLVWNHLPSGAPTKWVYYDWHLQWDARLLFDRFTIWCPPPELARQVLTFIMESWVERPLTTSALIFIPRTCSAAWSGISKYITRHDTIYPHKTLLRYPPVLPIPIEILYLPPHIRVLPPSPSLDSSPQPSDARWHQQQAALMRGLPGASLSR